MSTIKVDWSKKNSAASRASEVARAEARAYLASTDWYVVRQAETGKPIPEEVSLKRDQARAIL